MDIGTDIAKIEDFKGKDDNFFRHFLHGMEYDMFLHFKSEKRKYEFAAGRWAAKEAIFKATGENACFKWEVLNDTDGKPYVLDHSDLKISISHHGDYAIAVAMKL